MLTMSNCNIRLYMKMPWARV